MGRLEAFKESVCKRDGGCVISGQVNRSAYKNNWKGYHAAHIFPLEKAQDWLQLQMHRLDMPQSDAASKMNSAQNGMLLRMDLHDVLSPQY